MKSVLKPPRNKRLILEYDKLVSNFASRFNVRRCILDLPRDALFDILAAADPPTACALAGRGLHSSTFQLNLSPLCH